MIKIMLNSIYTNNSVSLIVAWSYHYINLYVKKIIFKIYIYLLITSIEIKMWIIVENMKDELPQRRLFNYRINKRRIEKSTS